MKTSADWNRWMWGLLLFGLVISTSSAQSDQSLARLPLRLMELPAVRVSNMPLDQAARHIAKVANETYPEDRPIEIQIAPGGGVQMPKVSVNILEQSLELVLDFVTEQAGFEWRIENGKIIFYTNSDLQKLHRQLLAIPGRERLRSTILPNFTLDEAPLKEALQKIESAAKSAGLHQLVPANGAFSIEARYQRRVDDIRVSGNFVRSDLDTVLEVLTKQSPEIDWTVEGGKVVIIVPGVYGVASGGGGGAADPFSAPVDPFAAPASPGRAIRSGRTAVVIPTIGGNPGAVLPPGPPGAFNTEAYDHLRDNPFLSPRSEPLSTFSIDVDTASYANVRRFLTQMNQLPPVDAVRIEELVNYFEYTDTAPSTVKNPPHPSLPVEHPFATKVEIANAPWARDHRLVRIGLKGFEPEVKDRPASNLVFLLDVSGSMSAENKLPLVKRSMKLLLNGLNEKDRVAIVVYAGSSGLALESTSADKKQQIRKAIDNLEAGGSTNAGQGIELAYQTAIDNLIPDGNNRVILCTDGDFNVGVTGKGPLREVVEKKADEGVQLTILGFGMGNYKDDMLETLSNYGDGNYGYIDSEREARKLFGQRLLGTLVMIAKDVKMQVEFNPRHVAAYRLIGYENRKLENEDFADDTVDAGDIGAGHTVTAFYEIVPPGVDLPKQPGNIKLRYQENELAELDKETAGELMTLKLRYKWPKTDTSRLIETPVKDDGKNFKAASEDFRFGAAVAGFGMLLRESPHRGKNSFKRVEKIAQDALGHDPFGERAEFLKLVQALVW